MQDDSMESIYSSCSSIKDYIMQKKSMKRVKGSVRLLDKIRWKKYNNHKKRRIENKVKRLKSR